MRAEWPKQKINKVDGLKSFGRWAPCSVRAPSGSPKWTTSTGPWQRPLWEHRCIWYGSDPARLWIKGAGEVQGVRHHPARRGERDGRSPVVGTRPAWSQREKPMSGTLHKRAAVAQRSPRRATLRNKARAANNTPHPLYPSNHRDRRGPADAPGSVRGVRRGGGGAGETLQRPGCESVTRRNVGDRGQ